MRLLVAIILLFFLGCSKEMDTSKHLFPESGGTALLFQIGQEFEGVYEYKLTRGHYEGALPFFMKRESDTSKWYLGSNPQPLFMSTIDWLQVNAALIPSENLSSISFPIPLPEKKVQLIDQVSNHKELWAKINHLKIVHDCRLANPKSHIAFGRMVVREYDESLGFHVPILKYYILLVH